MYFIFGLLHMKTLGEWNLNMSSLFSTTKCFPHRAKRQLYKLYILRILQNNQPPNESWLRLALNGRANRDFDIPQVAESGHLLPSHLRRLLNKSNLIKSPHPNALKAMLPPMPTSLPPTTRERTKSSPSFSWLISILVHSQTVGSWL